MFVYQRNKTMKVNIKDPTLSNPSEKELVLVGKGLS